jgi:pseudouridine-5'-phosphate glycosidase
MAVDLRISEEVGAALKAKRPVVALESTLISHGLPWPANLETAREAEAAVRTAGAVPATVAVLAGRPTIGLSESQLEELARSRDILKASRRDLAVAVTFRQNAATTVSATMALAHLSGIHVFATGGIGGVHRGDTEDVSADLEELARTPVLVVCAGAKSILDLPRTLERLETLCVPVIGYRTAEFPAFYVESTCLPVSATVNTAQEAARLFDSHVELGGRGVVLAQPCPADVAVEPAEFEAALAVAGTEATTSGITGSRLTPFLLKRLAELTQGRTLRANRALIVNNANLAGEVAKRRAASSQ